MSSKIVHIVSPEKFIPSFIKVIKEYFSVDDHKMIFFSKKSLLYGLESDENFLWISKKSQFFELSFLLHRADKIILHSLFFFLFCLYILNIIISFLFVFIITL